MTTLDQLQIGQRGRIEAIQGEDAVLQRLLEMGLFEGEEIEVVALAPFGDPIEIQLRDYRLSLRRSEAARLSIQVLSPKE
jgi:ferrous iron transport protein A